MPTAKDKARRMHEMYEAGDPDGVLALITSGVDVNARDEHGNALPHKAIRNELFVEALIKAGADVNARNEAGETPVTLVAAYGPRDENVDIVRMLLDAGADANAARNDGKSALHVYFREESERLVKLLIERDANVNATCTNGATPLH